jgi:hypothetical protein
MVRTVRFARAAEIPVAPVLTMSLCLAISFCFAGCGGLKTMSDPGAGPGAGAGPGPGTGTGGMGPGGMMPPGMGKNDGPGMGTGTAGSDGTVVSCTPGVAKIALTDCGYPYTSSNPLTSVVFNESEVLRAIVPAGALPKATVRLFYNDEHALTLGVRSVSVTTSSGTTTNDYPVSSLDSDPGSVTNAQLGTSALTGDDSGLDPSGRPMSPVLYLTDVTSDPNSRSGDWQMGGTPHAPTAVFGTWKAAVRNVDKTVSPAVVSITPDADPAKNDWNLGNGSDPVPSGLKDEGFGAEVRWDVSLTPGHSYRFQAMVHDGDQNKVGGDAGEACLVYCTGGVCGAGTTAYLTSEGAQTCVPTPTDGSCPTGYTNYLVSEGAVCVPTPNGGKCPDGYQLDPTSEGSRCI